LVIAVFKRALNQTHNYVIAKTGRLSGPYFGLTSLIASFSSEIFSGDLLPSVLTFASWTLNKFAFYDAPVSLCDARPSKIKDL